MFDPLLFISVAFLFAGNLSLSLFETALVLLDGKYIFGLHIGYCPVIAVLVLYILVCRASLSSLEIY